MDCPKTKEEWSVLCRLWNYLVWNLYDTNLDPSYSYIFCKITCLFVAVLIKTVKVTLEAITTNDRLKPNK